MTIWPGVVEPPLVQVRDARLERTREGVWIVQSGQPREVELPVDFYLVEPCQVDTRDPDALADFVGAWGRFCDPRMRDLGDSFYVFEEQIRAWGGREGWLADARHCVLGGLRMRAGDELGVPYERHGDDLVSPAEVAYRIERLRTFAQTAVALAAGERIAGMWRHRAHPTDEATAADRYAEALNGPLGAYAVRVAFGDRAPEHAPPVTAFTAACLQIANDRAKAVAYLTCASETCGRTFTKQRGRAVNGEHHTKGVRFCSRACALAQTQRERRRRYRAETVSARTA